MSVQEVRYRADGRSDAVGAVDAFKVSKHGDAWHLSPLRDWSRVMLDAYADTLPPSAFGMPRTRMRPQRTAGGWTFDTRTQARAFAEMAARSAR